jgi:hypothetical protein
MPRLKVGTRLRSAVCATEVMVVAAPADADVDVRCGGVPMLAPGETPPDGGALDAAASAGSALGKRYVSETGDLELLCVKPGKGSLAVGPKPLTLKEAKQLPSSD